MNFARVVGGALATSLVMTALAVPVHAEKDMLEERVASFRRMLKSGFLLESLSAGLDEEYGNELAAKPVAAYHFADAVATYARPTARRAPKEAEKLLAFTLSVGDKAIAAEPDNVSSKWAKAAALVARGRMEIELGGKPPPKDWTDAAALVLEGKKSGGRAPAIAVGYLVEASELPGVDPAPILAAADAALEGAASDERTSVARALVALARAKAAPAKCKPLVEQAIALLAPAVAKEPPDLESATLHNAIVSFAREKKVAVKADFRTKSKTAVGLEFAVPVSKWWEDPDSLDVGALLEQSEKGNFRFFGAYRQYDAAGNMVRSIRFDEYDWSTNYRFPNGDVASGDNIKGLARKDQQMIRDEFTKIASEKDVRKVPFNKKFPVAYVLEVLGTHKTGDQAHARLFLFKSEEKPKTYEVEIFEYGPNRDKLDPEAQAFLESISEPPKKK